MISSGFRLLRDALESSDLEARCGLVSVIILSLSAYTFRVDTAILIILLTLVFCPKKVLCGLLFSLPIISFFAVTSYLFGGLGNLPTVVALLCIGFLLYGITPEEFAGALMYFRFPTSFSHTIALAVRMFHIIVTDFERISEALKGERGYYLKLLKALTAVTIVRAFTMAEALYAKGFDFDRRVIVCRRPKFRDYALLLSSISILLYTCLTRNGL